MSNLDHLELYARGYEQGKAQAQRGIFHLPPNEDEPESSAPQFKEGQQEGREDGFKALFESL